MTDDDLNSQPADANAASQSDPGHVPVLPAPLLELLEPQPGQVMLDCTVGRGGHGLLFTPRLAPGGKYIGLDVDPTNIAYATARLADASVPVQIVRSNFALARQVLDELNIERVDLLLADLGFASNQMTDPTRGFSFSAPGPLDMRLDPDLPLTAADLVNQLPERELADLIYRFGEEPFSRRIARKIAEIRPREPILTTSALAQIVRSAYGRRAAASRVDPSTRTFMALRIAVNSELQALEQLLDQLPALMAAGGRAALISFHSLEDRMVKRAFTAMKQAEKVRWINRKPVTADDQERASNPRSRSAKLRVVEFNR